MSMQSVNEHSYPWGVAVVTFVAFGDMPCSEAESAACTACERAKLRPGVPGGLSGWRSASDCRPWE